MKVVGRILGAVAVTALLAGPAWAQSQPMQKYGEPDKEKSATEKAAEREAERAYKRSLGNIPEQKSTDPWGTVRSDSAPPKAAAKAPPAKPKAKSAEGAAK
jgi:hypothetical protein